MEVSVISAIILSSTGIIITGYYSWHSKRITNDHMMKELYNEFNHRYDNLNRDLMDIEKNYPDIEKFKEAPNSDKLRHAVIDYFNLCSEEFYWFHHKNRIDKMVWNCWHKGMNYWYNKSPVIKYLWKEELENNGEESYYIIDDNCFFINENNK